MEGALRLDLIIRKVTAVLELAVCKDQVLQVSRKSFLILDLRPDTVDSVARLDLKSNCFTSQGLVERVHRSSQPYHWVTNNELLCPKEEFKVHTKVKGRLLPYIVI